MGSAATKAKRKWNRNHYTNVTIAMNPKIAANLKADCNEKGISVTSVITMLITEYLNTEAQPPKESEEQR